MTNDHFSGWPSGSGAVSAVVSRGTVCAAGTWLEAPVDHGTRTTLASLQPWVTYQLRVLSLNDVGRSKPSPVIEVGCLYLVTR